MKAILVFILLAGCSRGGEESATGNATEPAASSQAAAAQDAPPTPAVDSKSPEAAIVLRRYFALIEAGQHAEAAKLWRDEEQAAAFAAGLRKFGDFQPSIAAPGRVEGAAGSLYVDISLQLLRHSRSGIEVLSDGTAVLRRANEVPGSTAEQRRWRIYRITLQPPPMPAPAGYRFVGRWASEERNCASRAWVFTASSLKTPAGSACSFSRVREVPGGYDSAANCTAEGPPRDDTLRLRFAESARALLFESDVIADAGLVRCP